MAVSQNVGTMSIPNICLKPVNQRSVTIIYKLYRNPYQEHLKRIFLLLQVPHIMVHSWLERYEYTICSTQLCPHHSLFCLAQMDMKVLCNGYKFKIMSCRKLSSYSLTPLRQGPAGGSTYVVSVLGAEFTRSIELAGPSVTSDLM